MDDHIGLISYPKSGSTILRKYLEMITGIATGSDTGFFPKDKELMKTAGLVGEGLYDERVWIIKSHYPECITPLRYFN